MLIADYQVDTQLYESVESLIYRAHRRSGNTPVILKLLKGDYPSPEQLARFRREYELTRRLQELDGIIQVFSFEPYQHTAFMEIEDFGGESLSHILAKRRLELSEFLSLASRLAEIVATIHQQRMIHKDINPSNIIWNPQTDILQIIDFGISSELSREQVEFQHPTVLEGTLVYMAPEQTGRMNRAVDYRSDLYSLGATFYHMLTGQLPFRTQDVMELVHCHLAKMPVPPIDVWAAVPDGQAPTQEQTQEAPLRLISDIIMKLLSKNAEDRYQSAYGLQKDLEELHKKLIGLEDLSAFIPGQHDFSERFQIPQKLYGREHELETLLRTFEKVETRGRSLLLLVTGHAGIGKSALVQEIYKPISENRGTFIAGKFEQLKRNIPYSAIIQAFQAFVHLVLTEPEEQIALWKTQLLNALGPNGQVMIDMIPEIELIIGPQPGIPELLPEQAHNRFKFVFQNFVKVCATKEHPLAMFLDDLQWADSSSLSLLELLLTTSGIPYLLIIGAYRNNEVSVTHPLALKLYDIQHAWGQIDTIALKPLSLEHVTQLLADTLHVISSSRTLALGQLALRKTNGNPFFLQRFVRSLYDEGFLKFDVHTREWTWNLEDIQKADMTDNVVELMVSRIQKLPEGTQHVLTLAACIGNRFDLQSLSIVHERSPEETLRFLWKALQEELITVLSGQLPVMSQEESRITDHWKLNTEFRFLHDRIQQAAYSLIDEERKQEVHLKIGELMLEKLPEIERTEKIFDIVNHLNIGQNMLTSQTEKHDLARLNLMAGQKAKASAAWHAAFSYLHIGKNLLAEESWQDFYELTLALYTEASEVAYLTGRFKQMENLAVLVLQHARTVLDTIPIFESKIRVLSARNKPLEAVQIAILALQRLGVKLSAQPSKFDVAHTLLITRVFLLGRHDDDFIKLPEMTDPDKLAAIRIFLRVIPAAQIARPELFILIVCRLVRWSVQGLNPASSFAYAAYGFVLSELIGDVQSGQRFANLALKILKRIDVGEFKAKTLMITHAFISFEKEHIRETLLSLLETYHIGLDIGDVEYAMISAMAYFTASYFVGSPLTEIEREMPPYNKLIGQFKQQNISHYHEILRQAILNLRRNFNNFSASPPWLLAADVYNEEQMLSQHQQANDYAALILLYIHKSYLCYLFYEYSQAATNLRMQELYSARVPSPKVLTNVRNLYSSLISLAVLSENHETSERKPLLRKITANQKKMKKWARHAPMNCQHKWELVEAERMRVLEKDADAMDYYDKAIQGARENKYLNEEALANELAARFYLAHGKVKIAQIYLREARYCYLKWGATTKVRHLERSYPQFFSSEHQHVGTVSHLPNSVLTTTHAHSANLDFSTVLKASQTVLSEVHVETLIEKILRVMVENAGAQKGVFIEIEGDGLLVRAKAELGQDATLLQTEIEEDRQELPRSIIHYAARSRQPLVFDDLSTETQYAADSYVRNAHPKSVLCLPVAKTESISAIVYLENNVNVGAFTADRLEVLQILASQAAISWENARLYATLEEQVRERTAELEQEVAERKRAEDTANAANAAKNRFLSSISHELRTPLNAILGYAQLLTQERELPEKLHDAIATISRSGEHLLLLLNDLLDLSKIEAGKIELQPHDFPLPQFLKNLVKNVRVHAQQNAIAVETEISPDIPAYVSADEVRLRQILLNLLSNAVQYTEKGSVTLRVSVLKDEKKKAGGHARLLHFEVEDSGIGIAPEHLQHIFSPFYQATHKAAKGSGTGLGLTIAQQLAAVMGSTIEVKSLVGQGTTFSFDLSVPVIEGSPVREATFPERRVLGYKGDSQKILIVDDREENRAVIRDMLFPLGFEIEEAADARDALHSAQKFLPNLILMDILMPEIDGFETARQIRQFDELESVTIVGMSASMAENIREQSRLAGFQKFLPKPIRLEELLECAATLLELKWIYSEADEKSTEEQSGDASLLDIPESALLNRLLDAAQAGCVTDIRQLIAEMKAADPKVAPFTDKVEEFVNHIQLEQIVELTEVALKHLGM